MREKINKWLKEVIEVITMSLVEIGLNDLIYATENKDIIDAFEKTPGWDALRQLRELASSPATDQETLTYLREETDRYIRLSSFGNYIVAEDYKKQFTDTLNKTLPHLNPSKALKAVLKNDWVIELLALKLTTVTELQLIERKKPLLLALLNFPEIPTLLMHEMFSVKNFIDMSDAALLTLGYALSKRNVPEKMTATATTKLAEATCDMLEKTCDTYKPGMGLKRNSH